MRRYLFVIMLVAAAATTAMFWGPIQEARAIWVVRFRLASPTMVDDIVRDAQKNRFNLLFAQIHGRGDAYYQSLIDPRAEALKEMPTSYDPLRYILDRGHAAGMQVHAWVNAFYVWPYPPPYPESEAHVVHRYPDWLIVDDEGRNLAQYAPADRASESIEGIYLDPANPQVREYVRDVCREVTANYDVDGIHLDYIRYPGPGWGFNGEAMHRFIHRWGVDPRLLSIRLRQPRPDRFIARDFPLHLMWHYYYQSLWAETKSYYVTEVVGDVSRGVRAIRPNALISAAVFPDPQVAYFAKGQDWPTWMARGYLDVSVPMVYHGDRDRVLAQVAEAQRRGAKGRVFAGLGAWKKDPAQIRDEVEHLKEIGIQGFSYFSYQGMKDRSDGYFGYMKKHLHSAKAMVSPLSGNSESKGGFLRPPWNEDGMEVCVRSLKKQFFSVAEYEAMVADLGGGEDALQRRLSDEVQRLEWLTEHIYPAAQPAPEDVVILPPSVELQSIFVYVHARDGTENRQRAYVEIQEAHTKLMEGREFSIVADDWAQDGWPRGGKFRERVYLSEDWDVARIIKGMREGDVTPVIDLPNGYVVYKVLTFYPAEARRYGELPWRLKRVAFQARFAELVQQSAVASGR